ncbi:MAG: hypothetical protein JRF63_08425 [Deltaproteobacteria bacterium]|nr:hypothetical protein [Deltaproteobacteria bacterium]
MPITFTVSTEENLIRTVAVGEVHLEDIQRYVQEQMSHPDIRPGMNEIVDMREATLDLTYEKMQQVVGNIEPFNEKVGEARCALVSGVDISFAFARMYEMMAEQTGVETRAFREMAAALEWLGIDTSAE